MVVVTLIKFKQIFLTFAEWVEFGIKLLIENEQRIYKLQVNVELTED